MRCSAGRSSSRIYLSGVRKTSENTRTRSNSGCAIGARFPAGFNSGQRVDFILDRIALTYSTIKSFDDLPIPFRCIATELVSRSMHVFKDGSLPQALRATMSIPGFFTPVKDRGKIYVDGGLLDNLPTDVAKDMGADITIAVHLEQAPISPDASLSSVATLVQAFSVVTAVNERRGMELADVLVRVDLTKFGGGDYRNADKLIAQGYKAAQGSAPALSKFAVDNNVWQAYLGRREARRIKSVPVPSFVEVIGTTPQLAETMERSLKESQGRPTTEHQLGQKPNVRPRTGPFHTLWHRHAELGP